MGRRIALLLVASLLAMSWGGTLPVDASEGRGNEGMSILLTKEVWSSAETFEATVGTWGLSSGRLYTVDWQIRSGNGTHGSEFIVRSGQQNFTATNSAMQIQIHANHLIAGSNHLYRLLTNLSDYSGHITTSQVNFSAFTNTLPVPYSDIVIFGDSLSDMGNSFNQWGTPDSPPYWNGRFSNGEVWATQFGEFMMGPGTMNPGRGTAGGNNRAYGGAHSGDGSYLFVIPNVGKQVTDYLQNHQINPNELVIIWCGGNDFVHSDETDTQQVVDNIEGHITTLSNAGATEFLILELPPLDTVPRINEEQDEDGVKAMHERIRDFNSKLHTMLNATVNTTSLTIHRGMMWEMFDTVYNNAGSFGLTNVTHPACEHDGYTCEDGDPIAPNAEEYIYFDKMHPTLTMHDLVDLYIRELMGVDDIDGDRLADIYDNCLDTMPGIEIGADGCDLPPPDADGDGIPDEEDDCDDTGSGLAVDQDGCALNQLDTDGDGITDDLDDCPDTEPGRSVDGAGCSGWQLDGDSDGVADAEDLCPYTSLEAIVDEDGCSARQRDSDDDTVNDEMDDCPDTPRGETIDQRGCSASQRDSDFDGVLDADDRCGQTDVGSTGVDAEGCAPYQRDTDEDGITDDLDLCPDTAWLDSVDTNGCSEHQRDSDGDGPKDADDNCPFIPGSISGCPILTVELALVEVPDTETRTANISVTVTCESGCEMWLSSLTLSVPSNTTNGTYHTTVVGNVSMTFTVRVSVAGIWTEDHLYVAFPPEDEGPTDVIPPDAKPDGPDDSQSSKDSSAFDLDVGSIAMIAVLLLLNVVVVAGILAARSRAREKDPEALAISAFERDLFGDAPPEVEPVDDGLPKMDDLL